MEDRMTDQTSSKPADDIFARLATVPVPVMTGYLLNELSQTVAAVLLLLPQERAAAILKRMPPNFFQDIVRRMASSEALLPAPRAVLAATLEREFLPNGPRPATPDRREEVQRLIGLMDPELRAAATKAIEPLPERPEAAPSVRPPDYAWPDLNALAPRNPEAADAPLPETIHGPLPLLEVVHDRFVRMLSTSVRVVTGLNAEITLDNIGAISQGEYLERLPLPALFCPFTAEGGGYCGMVVASPQLLFEMCDALLGGTIGLDMSSLQLRPFTTIERGLIELALDAMLADLSSAFDAICSAKFQLDRLETNPRFAAIAAPDTAMFLGTYRVDFAKGGGKFHLLLSEAALGPLHEILPQQIVPPAHQPKPPLVVPNEGGPKLKLAAPPAERRNA